MKKTAILFLVVVAAVVLCGAWLYFGGGLASLIGMDLPFTGRQTVIVHNATFYPGKDIQAVVGALIQNQLMGDVGGLCDQGITCEGRQIIKAGTHVVLYKKATMQNGQLNVTFAQIKVGEIEGWVIADAVED